MESWFGLGLKIFLYNIKANTKTIFDKKLLSKIQKVFSLSVLSQETLLKKFNNL
jgi:hypothetical protein